MPLNSEERFIQYLYNQKQEARTTSDQLEAALLEQQLEHAQNTISYLDDYIDKQTEIIDEIRGAIQQYAIGERGEGVTLDTIMQIVGWRR